MSEVVLTICAYVCDKCDSYLVVYSENKELMPETILCKICGEERVLLKGDLDERYLLGKRVLTT